MERERERARERARERERERQRQRDRERETDRQTAGERCKGEGGGRAGVIELTPSALARHLKQISQFMLDLLK